MRNRCCKPPLKPGIHSRVTESWVTVTWRNDEGGSGWSEDKGLEEMWKNLSNQWEREALHSTKSYSKRLSLHRRRRLPYGFGVFTNRHSDIIKGESRAGDFRGQSYFSHQSTVPSQPRPIQMYKLLSFSLKIEIYVMCHILEEFGQSYSE